LIVALHRVLFCPSCVTAIVELHMLATEVNVMS
jgi:hypothetical protein